MEVDADGKIRFPSVLIVRKNAVLMLLNVI